MAHKAVVIVQMLVMAAPVVIDPNTTQHVGSGIMAHAHLGCGVKCPIAVQLVPRMGGMETTRLLTMEAKVAEQERRGSVSNQGIPTGLATFEGGCKWTSQNFIMACNEVAGSGRPNFEVCRIPVPTSIRYDRIEEALEGSVSVKERRVLDLLKFGMPVDCQVEYGIKKQQKNHFSALSFKEEIEQYLQKGKLSQAILGPFHQSPINGLCFSPLMSVPKEESQSRIIVDFSFPPGQSINDGISKSTYLESSVDFSLPSVQSMVSRLNELGRNCLMYKRDLKGAFRQFPIDPRDYRCTGLSWNGMIYVDTRLAMGLRSAAYCCQSVTELVAKIASKSAHVLVYLDDFGGAELAEKAMESFKHLGWLLEHFGLVEAPEKAVSPSTEMDWLGISFNTVEWSMALKPGKLQELLTWLPRLLSYNRVKKVLLQKILGSLVWASAVVRAGVIFFNRLLVLLRKLKRPHHSIHFSKEAKKDVRWWIQALMCYKGKCQIPASVWTPLAAFSTDASLEGFGMVWGNRALAGLFLGEFDSLDISKKEMLTVMAAIKHWFADLSNLRVKIFIDNQACVALLNYGITRSPFMAACLREVQFYLASFNIELRAEYIASKDNVLADLCSHTFSSDVFYENFNKLLNDRTLILENVYYNKFNFEYDL